MSKLTAVRCSRIYQNVAQLNRFDQWRVFVNHNAVNYVGLQCQRLNRGVPMQLYILSGTIHELQKTIRYLVLSNTLIADEEQMVSEQKVLKYRESSHNQTV
jgi:hypothetical protein